MPCHATHPMQDLSLESFSYELQFDMHFYMHSYLQKKIYSCKKWVLQRCSENLGSLAMGCHPRYKLPIQHHKVQENLESTKSEEGVGSSIGAAGAGACYSWS
jgi:hypothetical protein